MVQLYLWLCSRVQEALKQEQGQSLAEYGLILALIAVVCIAALTLLGGNISTLLGNLAGSL